MSKIPDADSQIQEIDASWSLFILISLLIIALLVSYMLQARRIQAVHETVISILAGIATKGDQEKTIC